LLAATSDIPQHKGTRHTPLEDVEGNFIKRGTCVIVPVLRAGIAPLTGHKTKEFLQEIGADIQCVGIYRDEKTRQPVDYYNGLKPMKEGQEQAIVVDPMLATGGTAEDVIKKLYALGYTKVKMCALFSAPEGIRRLQKMFPDLKITSMVIDRCLNDMAYILPGLGDCGDRFFGQNGWKSLTRFARDLEDLVPEDDFDEIVNSIERKTKMLEKSEAHELKMS
jgi:uracil phosphoribosyltransferase